MIINKTYKFRLYPDKTQEQMLLQQTGNSRFVWNKLVEFNTQYNKDNDKFPSQVIFQKKIVELKKEFEFIKLAHSQPLQINAKRMCDLTYSPRMNSGAFFSQKSVNKNKKELDFIFF